MNLSINPFAPDPGLTGSSAISDPGPPPTELGTIPCPNCAGGFVPIESETGWQSCPWCATEVQALLWPVIKPNANPAVALSDQATCFFHPEKAFQACCQRCGRFVCALCDLQLGSEHVCPTCFERGRADSGPEAAKAEWRYRDVLYDSIALTIGWAWILFWPSFIAALPAAIFMHVRYRKAPRSYLVPRRGWRFWFAYVGLVWPPILVGVTMFAARMARRH